MDLWASRRKRRRRVDVEGLVDAFYGGLVCYSAGRDPAEALPVVVVGDVPLAGRCEPTVGYGYAKTTTAAP